MDCRESDFPEVPSRTPPLTIVVGDEVMKTKSIDSVMGICKKVYIKDHLYMFYFYK